MKRTTTRARKPNRLTKYTELRVSKALIAAQGLISTAAKNMGCNRNTVYECIKRYNLEDVVHDAREAAIDHVESLLMKAMNGGDVHAMIFFLKTQGKSRGYVERSEHDLNPDDKPIRFTMNIGNANGSAA